MLNRCTVSVPGRASHRSTSLDNFTLNLLNQTVEHFAVHAQQAYLVGGSLRNLLLGEPFSDWDIAVSGDAHKLARRLADHLGGHYVRMHEKASRVVVRHPELAQDITLDIAPLHGNTIEEDLRARDFTVNAIAAPLAAVTGYLQTPGTALQHSRLHDPLRGLADIQACRLRAVDSNVFQHDPLRMLRAMRLSTRYHLTIDPSTEGLLIRDAALLPQSAPERIHDELYTILEPEGATARLRLLDRYGLLIVLFPEFRSARGMAQPMPHHWDVLEHSLETVGTLERLAQALHDATPPAIFTPTPATAGDFATIRSLLGEAEAEGIFSFAALSAPPMKLAALLHDIGKPITYTTDEQAAVHFYNHPQAGIPLAQDIMHRLSASVQDRRLVQLVTAHHMRPGQLGQDGPVTPRAIRRFFVDLGPAGIYVALLSLADHLATRGPQPLNASWERHLGVVRLLLNRYIRERYTILPPRLISPEELMRRLRIDPGPLVGQLLELIAEAQAEGTIHSKEEALWLAQERLSNLS